ncbi:hypothetical protein LGT41_0009025 [Abyssibius alkaniclasticus]|uniref:hypothetical protein n=1 Tax=Abyssibius alkaniclasticus TaxID=2881234 RepID=UPI002363668E|nr:hypothetical protein [Abyssibius alkaniclasticus]UPH69962.1 hypothetical protein LGT41_0009025 [Abyssibius alkaniclasticus]
MSDETLTILNRYNLLAPAAQFDMAVLALVRRVEQEGHRGVLSYRFFANPREATAQAVIEYENPTAWIGHHDTSMDWPEMKALHKVAGLAEVTFLGAFTDEIEAWLNASSLSARLKTGNRFAAGFTRAK